jgi:hypothetical protein
MDGWIVAICAVVALILSLGGNLWGMFKAWLRSHDVHKARETTLDNAAVLINGFDEKLTAQTSELKQTMKVEAGKAITAASEAKATAIETKAELMQKIDSLTESTTKFNGWAETHEQQDERRHQENLERLKRIEAKK